MILEEVNATHRPKFVAMNETQRGGARQLNFEGIAQQVEMEPTLANLPLEKAITVKFTIQCGKSKGTTMY